MPFDARLRIPGSTKIPLAVEVDVSRERLTVISGLRELANWPLDSVEVSALSDGFHIRADGEEIVLDVLDSSEFASTLGIAQHRPLRTVSSESARQKYARAGEDEDASGAGDTDPQLTESVSKEQYSLRIASAGKALTSNSTPPPEAFKLWLNILRELNHELGSGTMSPELFNELNTRALGLMPSRS